MNTLSKEKELIELLVDKISQNVGNEVTVININDYTDERTDHMISVGISNTVNVNPMLPDYEYTVEVLVDSFIANDKYGKKFEENKEAVLNFFEPYLMNKDILSELFLDIPVVGFFIDGISNQTTEESNRSHIQLRVIVSY